MINNKIFVNNVGIDGGVGIRDILVILVLCGGYEGG